MLTDGIMCVTPFRTLRLKRLTVDLVHMNGKLHASSKSGPVTISPAHECIGERSIYELTVSRTTRISSCCRTR